MTRLMTTVMGLGLATGGVFFAQDLIRQAEGARVDARLLHRQMEQTEARHQEWMERLRSYREDLPAEYERQYVFGLAAADTDRHVRLDLSMGQLSLVEDGYVVRVSSVEVGPSLEATADHPAVSIERGIRQIEERVRRGRFEMPAWADPQGEASDKPVKGLYGDRTLVLDDDTVLYSTPKKGPWASDDQVRPGGVEMSFTDMASIFGAVSTGARVYVY